MARDLKRVEWRRERLREAFLPPQPFQSPATDASLDVVCCLEGIEHVPVEVGRKFLDESRRVLAPGGTLLLSSPYCRVRAHSGNPYHIHEYGPEEIRAEVERNFAIDEVIERDVDILRILYIRATRRA